MKVVFLYYNFFDSKGIERKVGGVETYLLQLSRLVHLRGDTPILIQPASVPFEKNVENLKVIGVPPRKRFFGRVDQKKDMYDFALTLIDPRVDLLIFGADHASVRSPIGSRALSIQHGISWDLPARYLGSPLWSGFLWSRWIRKLYVTARCRRYFENCNNRVCVDYNFVNWYRTQVTDTPKGRIWTIPNFVEIKKDFLKNLDRHDSSSVKILFARRFVEYRGSRLMADAARSILSRFDNVQFTFAGEGPDHKYLSDIFRDDPRVLFIKYMPEESMEIHVKHHIAVVPSIASEGTSLSVAEAMGAGCAVVATNVGGMTNMIVDGYNGLLIEPNVPDLVAALEALILDAQFRKSLATSAADTAQKAFSVERWNHRWSRVLDEVGAM